MADKVNHNTMHVIEQCEVSPPLGSLPLTSVPLSYLDLPWFYSAQMKRIFFYEFPHPTHHFLQTVLPILKRSLSLTLQHFFPFAANVVFPPKPQTPHILYSPGDSVSFTVAESTADITHLVSDAARDVRHLHPFVPVIPSPRTLEDGTLLIPTTAIQVTVLANSGFTLCVAFRHEIADGRAFHHFMKYWASVCRSRGDLASSLEASLPLPLHNRDMIEDPKGLKLNFLEELWNSPPKTIEPTSAPSDTVRQRFVLSRHQVENLKKWVSIKCQVIGLDASTLHLSTFAVTGSLFWVCEIKSKPQDVAVDTVPSNEDFYAFCFTVDLRNRPELSIPSIHFGNCLALCRATLPKGKIVGQNGICEAVNAIGSQIRALKGDPLKGVEGLISGRRSKELGKRLQRVVLVAGSPKLNVYETDFGWGKPKLSEILHGNDSSVICLSDCRDEDCGIEVGIALKGAQMKKFSSILEEQLRDIAALE